MPLTLYVPPDLAARLPELFSPPFPASPVDPPTQLEQVINTADAERVKTVLRDMCKANPEAKAFAHNALLVDASTRNLGALDTDVDSSSSSAEAAAAAKGNQTSNKRKSDEHVARGLAARYVKCENCACEFDTTCNEEGSCIWHEGVKELFDADGFWDDHDENCHGRYEDLEDDSDFAEGFAWSCCQRLGDGEGCRRTRHLAVEVVQQQQAAGKKRARVG